MAESQEETLRRLADSQESLLNLLKPANTGLNTSNRDRLEANEGASRQRFTTGVNTIAELFEKVGSGTLSTGDAFDATARIMNKFGTVTGTVGDIFNQLGSAAIKLNDVLKETGKYGVTFGNDLGEANQLIKDSHLTLNEFADIISRNSQGIAGMSSTMDKSAKAFLQIAADVETSQVGRDLRAAGMSSKELAEITQLSLSRKRIDDIKDAEEKKRLTEAAARMAEEFTFISDITGKNRKQLLDEQRKITESTEVLAATLKYGAEFKTRLDSATTELSPMLKRIVSEEATGGVRTEEGRKIAASLGPAYDEAKKLADAIKAGAPSEEIKKRAVELQAANAKTIEQQADATMVLGDRYLMYGQNLQENYQYVQAIASKQEEMRKLGQDINKEEAHRLLEREGFFKRAGLDEEGKLKEGAIAGRAINQIDYLGKVAGSVAAEGLKQLNDRLGHAAKDSIPAFEKALNDFSTGQKAILKAQEAGLNLINNITGSLGTLKGFKSREEELAAEEERKKNLPKREDGSLGATGKYFEDFGKGTEVELHGKEGVFTEQQIKDLVRDVSINQTQKENKSNTFITENLSNNNIAEKQYNSVTENLSNSISDIVYGIGNTASKTYDSVTENLSNNNIAEKQYNSVTENLSNSISDIVYGIGNTASKTYDSVTKEEPIPDGFKKATDGRIVLDMRTEEEWKKYEADKKAISEFDKKYNPEQKLESPKIFKETEINKQLPLDYIPISMRSNQLDKETEISTLKLDQLGVTPTISNSSFDDMFSTPLFNPLTSIDDLNRNIGKIGENMFMPNLSSTYPGDTMFSNLFDTILGFSTATGNTISSSIGAGFGALNLFNNSNTQQDHQLHPFSLFEGISDIVYGIGNIASKTYDSVTKEEPIPDGFKKSISEFDKKYNPERISELVRQSSSDLYNKNTTSKATEELKKIELDAYGKPINSSKSSEKVELTPSMSSLGTGADSAALKEKYKTIQQPVNSVDKGKIKDPLSRQLDMSSIVKDWQHGLVTEKKAEESTKSQKSTSSETALKNEPSLSTKIEEPPKTTDNTTMSDIKEELVRLNSNIRELISHTDGVAEGINRQVKATKGLSGNLLS